jgi:dihydroorotate dehydrogenase (NAD+) catalytic subunit
MNSIGPAPRTGHPEPTVYDWGTGLINAIGLANPGAQGAIDLLCTLKKELAQHNVTLIVSIFADTTENYFEVARVISAVDPALVEVNLSCPNVVEEFGIPFATNAATAGEAVAAARQALTCPISAKLAPNVPDIVRIGEAVVKSGADMLTVSNTMPGMIIDVETRKPVLSNRSGGVSGDALRPIAVRMVYELYEALSVPVIGTGGVLRGIDAVEMIMAGATAVGLATIAHRHGVAGLRRVVTELDEWMTAHGVHSLDEIKGMAHG